LGWANNIIRLYGLRSFLADIDAERDYWREGRPEGESIIHTVLGWLANDGFYPFFSQLNGNIDDCLTAQQYRQRYLIAAFRSRPKL
jgi:hypothetical protein